MQDPVWFPRLNPMKLALTISFHYCDILKRQISRERKEISCCQGLEWEREVHYKRHKRIHGDDQTVICLTRPGGYKIICVCQNLWNWPLKRENFFYVNYINLTFKNLQYKKVYINILLKRGYREFQRNVDIIQLTETKYNGKGRVNDLGWNIILASYEQDEIALVT